MQQVQRTADNIITSNKKQSAATRPVRVGWRAFRLTQRLGTTSETWIVHVAEETLCGTFRISKKNLAHPRQRETVPTRRRHVRVLWFLFEAKWLLHIR